MSYKKKGLQKPAHPRKKKSSNNSPAKRKANVLKKRVVDAQKLFQLNEELASCLQDRDLDGADRVDTQLIKLVGTDNRVVFNRVVAPPRLMFLYAFNRAMLKMNRGYVQEAALSMVDVMETLYFGGVQEEIYFVFDMLAEQRGKHDQFSKKMDLACDHLLMAILCTRRFPAMSLSFFWKSKLLFEKVGRMDLAQFAHAFVKIQYGQLSIACEKSDPEGAKLFREAASKIQAKLIIPKREEIESQVIAMMQQRQTEIQIAQDEQLSREAFVKQCECHVKTWGEARKVDDLYPQFDAKKLMLIREYGDLDKDSKKLPNILDVLEMVCFDEERYAAYYDKTCKLIHMSGSAHSRDGEIDTVVNPDGKFTFLPKGVVKNLFYRGQTNFKSPCQPSLYRKLSEKAVFVERLKLCEFAHLLEKHPSVNLFKQGLVNRLDNGYYEQHGLNIDVEALAQHYGVKTEYLDLTVDKWVAAFFACCDYKVAKPGERDTYEKHKEDSVGVFYVYQAEPDYTSDGDFRPVGMQPQSRPVLQAGVVRKLDKDDDFNKMATAIPFRYDSRCVGILFWLFDQSSEIMPTEVIESKAKRIVEEKDTFSAAAFNMAHNRYYKDLSDEEFEAKVCDYTLHRQAGPLVDFMPEELQKTIEERKLWEQYLWHNTRIEQIIMMPREEGEI